MNRREAQTISHEGISAKSWLSAVDDDTRQQVSALRMTIAVKNETDTCFLCSSVWSAAAAWTRRFYLQGWRASAKIDQDVRWLVVELSRCHDDKYLRLCPYQEPGPSAWSFWLRLHQYSLHCVSNVCSENSRCKCDPSKYLKIIQLFSSRLGYSLKYIGNLFISLIINFSIHSSAYTPSSLMKIEQLSMWY